MTIPNSVRLRIKQLLWGRADEIGWMTLSSSGKSMHYENWTQEEAIGGVLCHYMDKGQIRVYIKDSLLKDYSRQRLANNISRVLMALGITESHEKCEAYVKPHGRRFADGRVISWGRADDWKLILLATYERAFGKSDARPFGAVLLNATGRFQQDDVRGMIQDAASRLGVEKVCWLDT